MTGRHDSGSPDFSGPASPTRLDEVMLRALAVDSAERKKYLAEVAAVDPALAAEARRRLAASEDLHSTFLRQPAAARLAGDDQAEGDEGQEGFDAPQLAAAERYRLGAQLGEGGMGRVFEAQDLLLGRRVALKFLTHPDPSVRRLFLAEGRAQARIRHDHVLEVYDGGELEGNPFLAMRYVDGGTLGEVAEGLSLEGKVRLLIQAAEGLHAAHREGLLHRDVKPSNILVAKNADGEWSACVSDFGIAADVGQSSLLTSDQVAGSPHFIAPECLEAGREVDRRADVYSLGMTIYQLLTGTLPFSGPLTVDVLRQALEGELPPPRSLRPGFPAELEAIILRCLERRPQDRYASARAVAEDLQRYLDGEVVEAYAAGLAYRWTRFALRHKVLMAMGAAVAVLLALAVVAVVIFAVRGDAARQRAELRQAQAEELIRFMVVDLQEKLAPGSRLEVLEDVAGAAHDYFAAVPEDELSEAELLRRSRTLYQLGHLHIRQGNLPAAAEPMQQSLALTRRLASLEPEDPERLFELGQSWFWVGFVAWEQGDLVATRGPWQTYLGISRALAERDADHLDWQLELSYAHSNLGSLAEAEGNLPEARERFAGALEINRALVAADPENRLWRLELAACHNTLAVTLQALGELEEAYRHLQAELGLLTALAAEDPEDLRVQGRLATSHSYTGKLLIHRDRLQPAEEHLSTVHRLLSALVAHDPGQASWRYKLALSHLDLGRFSWAQGARGAAEEHWREAEVLIGELLSDTDPSPDDWLRTRGVIRFHRGLLAAVRGDEEAGATVDAAVEELATLAKTQPKEWRTHRWLAWARLLQGELETSPEAREAIFAAAEGLAPLASDSRDGRLLAPWAEILRCRGRYAEAGAVDAALEAKGFAEIYLLQPCPAT